MKKSEPSRRDFLQIGLSALSALALFETGVIGLTYLRSRSQEGSFGGKIKAGRVTDFPPGSVTEFAQEGFFLIHPAQGDFKAVYRRCPHLGCTVDWMPEENQFSCPCHGSSFDANGNFASPPVPRSLDVFPVTIEAEVVVVDTSHLLRSDQNNPGS